MISSASQTYHPSQTQAAASSSSSSSSKPLDLWTDILRSADRRNSLRRKNLILLSERHHGRRYLLERLLSSSTSRKERDRDRSKKDKEKEKERKASKGMAMGYEVMEIGDDGDEDSAPPLSIFYPPSSHRTFTRLIPIALPPKSLADTAVMIVLDWTRPATMVRELLHWLAWVEEWASTSAERGQAEELREKLQSHLQHYAEPAPTGPAASSSSPSATPVLPSISSVYGTGPLLPLGSGTLTLNTCGIPITVVCTKADLMDSVGDEIGLRGSGWEERTDWIQQVLRTVCLSYGASLFFTATTQPSTYTLLRQYLLHMLYTQPPPLNPSSDTPTPPSSARFPFSHRANVLDRDAVLVPAGWDSWGKINVLREGFEPGRVCKAWERSLSRGRQADEGNDEGEGIEDLWMAMVPDTDRHTKPKTRNAITATTEPEQAFLARQFEILQKDPNRDPRQSFRTPLPTSSYPSTSTSASATSHGNTVVVVDGGVVGPMGGGGMGLNLPGVEKAMAEMEGSRVTGDDLREKFARLGRRETSRSGGPLSPTGTNPSGTPSAVPNEALHNFFQGLLANKGKSASSTSTSTSTKDKTSSTPPAEAK